MTDLKIGSNGTPKQKTLKESQTTKLDDQLFKDNYNRSHLPMKSDNDKGKHGEVSQIGVMNLNDNILTSRVPIKDFQYQDGHFQLFPYTINDHSNTFDMDCSLESPINGLFDNYQFNRGPWIDPVQYHFDLLNHFDRNSQHNNFISNGNFDMIPNSNKKVDTSLSEIGTQTDGFMIPLNGPFYIGSQECFISDEKWIEACVHFMQLRSEFLSMLGYSSFSADDENQHSDNVFTKKRRRKSASNKSNYNFNSSQCIASEKNIVQLSPENLRERDSLDAHTNHNFCSDYIDEESRASGVPILKPSTMNPKQLPQAKSTLRKAYSNNSTTSSSENLYNIHNFYFKRRNLNNEMNFQTDNGATPGRPRMNRSDFACTLCQTRNTPQWRYLEFEPVCNACYMRARKQQRGFNHPSSFSSSKIKLNRVSRLNRDKETQKFDSNNSTTPETIDQIIIKETLKSTDYSHNLMRKQRPTTLHTNAKSTVGEIYLPLSNLPQLPNLLFDDLSHKTENEQTEHEIGNLNWSDDGEK